MVQNGCACRQSLRSALAAAAALVHVTARISIEVLFIGRSSCLGLGACIHIILDGGIAPALLPMDLMVILLAVCNAHSDATQQRAIVRCRGPEARK